MEPEAVNKNRNCVFNDLYAGRDLYITMLEDKEREFVVTHNANIKPVSYFTGRETELQDLRQRVEEGRKSVLVSGMGGIGKTHICRKLFGEYLKKHADGGNCPFQHIGYIEYNGDMGSSLQSCLKFRQQDNPEKNQEAAWKELEYLASDGKLLLFVDNVDRLIGEDAGLQSLRDTPGAVVLTSRQTSFSDEFELYQIGFLDMEQCKEIYEKIRFGKSGKKISPDETQDLEYVIESLAGRHTITVELLAHLARTKPWSVKKLRGELEEKGFRLTFHKDGKLVNIQESYEVLYDLSGLTGAEQNILEAFSVFPYIPLAAETCNEWLLADAGVSEDEDILMGLYQKGWLQFDGEQESYALHPVFAQFVYEKCKPAPERHLGLIEACQKRLEISESSSALECQKYIPVAESMIERLGIGNNLEQSGFISRTAKLLHYTAEYKKAEVLYKKSLWIKKRMLGEEHLDTARGYGNLAGVYESQGKYGRAEVLYEKALAIRGRVLGEEHPNTAVGYGNLAGVYERQGKYGRAEVLYEKALAIRERVLGEKHRDTAVSYNNLAYVYMKQGKYGRAEVLYEKALAISERVLGEKHLDTAASYNNLAYVYMRQGKYGRAEALCEKALAIRERMLGEGHPDTAASYNNLAYVYASREEYKKAEELYEKSLRIIERVLGGEHPNISVIYNNLAVIYQNQGEYKKAKGLCEKSLRIMERVFGEEHPDIAMGYINLAKVYESQGEYKKAKGLYEKSLRIMEKVFGEEHPDIAMGYNYLANVYRIQKEYGKAEELFNKSLRIYKSMLQENYPGTAEVNNNLAMMYEEQGEYAISLDYYLKAYKFFVSKLGLGHLKSRNIRKNMKLTYIKWDKESDFDQWLEEKMKE